MRTYVTGFAALVLMLSGALFVGGDAAEAEDGKLRKLPKAWVYELRIVRVDPADPKASEAGSPFPELQGTTLGLGWPDILARLKQRGTTRVLMDTRVTARAGVRSTTLEESTTPVMAINSQDRNNEQYRAQMIRQGCSFTQTTVPDLTYDLQVRGALDAPGRMRAPVSYSVAWKGTHPLLDGRTLVLEHRQQVAVVAKAPRASAAVTRLRASVAAHRTLGAALQAELVSCAKAVRDAQAEHVRHGNSTTKEAADAKGALVRARAAHDRAQKAQQGWYDQLAKLQKALSGVEAASPKAAPSALRAVEHYAFVTGRPVP